MMGKKVRTHFTCPAELTFHVLGGKWRGAIVAHLNARAMRYSELRRAVPQLSDKVLGETLRELERFGVVSTLRSNGARRGTKLYCLTSRGKAVAPMLRLACAWARAHAGEYGVRFLHGPPCEPNALQVEFQSLIAEFTEPRETA